MTKIINVSEFNARGNIVTTHSRGSIDASSDILKVAGANFTSNDINKIICISNVGSSGAALRTIITNIKNTDEVILGSRSTTSGTRLTVIWGTNDTSAIQKAIDNAKFGDIIIFPPGVYCIYELHLKSGITFLSLEGLAQSTMFFDIPKSCIPETMLRPTILTQIIRDNSTLFVDRVRPGDILEPLSDITFHGLDFDGNIDHDENLNITSQFLELSNVSGHSNIKFLNCKIKKFSKGIYVHGTSPSHSYSGFEIKNCTFIKNVYSIYFHDTNTRDIKIKDCKFIDCYQSIKVHNNEQRDNTCDYVLIEECHFCGKFHGYPIHFGSLKGGVSATHVTVKGCVIVGPDKWWILEGSSADQIALHNVEHFSVLDNTSTN